MMDAQPAHKGRAGSASGFQLVYERPSAGARRDYLNYFEDQLFRADAAKLDQAAPYGCGRAAGSKSLPDRQGCKLYEAANGPAPARYFLARMTSAIWRI